MAYGDLDVLLGANQTDNVQVRGMVASVIGSRDKENWNCSDLAVRQLLLLLPEVPAAHDRHVQL